MGAHHPRHAAHETPTLRRLAWLVIAPLALATLVAMVVLWPSERIATPESAASASEVRGEVTSIDRETCAEELADDVNGCGTALVLVEEGSAGEGGAGEAGAGEAGAGEAGGGAGEAGSEIESPLPNGAGAPEVEVGDAVVLIESAGPDGTTYTIVDQQRGTQLWVLAAAFALAVVAFGRWRGVAALGGLVVTFGVLVLFVVPAILAGEPPTLVAIVGSAAIMLVVLYLTHGVSLSTTVAVLGTLSALTLTGLLSAAAVSALSLSGISDDVSFSVGSTLSVDTQGLLLAGIVIGALGVLDDVTVTQGAAVSEIARANPGYGFAALYRSGSRVGRSHIASVINTIVLAYAGSSLPLIVLIIASNGSLGSVVTDQVIAQEIVRTVVGTLGLIAAVPLTTALAAAVSVRARGSRGSGEGRGSGSRSGAPATIDGGETVA